MENITNQEILKHLPWSYSKLETARKCPFSFNRRYIDKVPAPYVENEAAKIGRMMHEILENCLKGQNINDAYKKVCIVKNQLTTHEMERCVGFRPRVISFLEKIKDFEIGNAVSRKFVEIDVAITADFKPAGYWDKDPLPLFRGKMDFGILNDKNYLCIIDHKTGDVPTKQYSFNQMLSYEVLSYYGLREPVKGVKTMLHFISTGDILQFDGVSEEDIVNKRKFEFIRFMESCVSEIPSNTPKTGKHCDWCSYKTICPAQK